MAEAEAFTEAVSMVEALSVAEHSVMVLSEAGAVGSLAVLVEYHGTAVYRINMQLASAPTVTTKRVRQN